MDDCFTLDPLDCGKSMIREPFGLSLGEVTVDFEDKDRPTERGRSPADIVSLLHTLSAVISPSNATLFLGLLLLR